MPRLVHSRKYPPRFRKKLASADFPGLNRGIEAEPKASALKAAECLLRPPARSIAPPVQGSLDRVSLLRKIVRSRTMQRSDRSALSATRGGAQPVPDALAEFGSERPTSIEPAVAHPAPIERAIARPAPHPPDIRRARPAIVASAVRAIGSDKRGGLWSFAFGSLFGALLCLVIVNRVMTSEFALPPPAARALLEHPPAAEPSMVVADARREPPVPDPPVVNTSRPPTPAEPVRSMPAPAPVRPTPAPKPARPTPAPKPPSRAVPAAAVPVPREGTSARFVGSLQIDSTPRGARVFIDREPVGVTPLVLTGLVAGSHVIRLEADGHTAWSSAIRIIADRQIDVRTTLASSVENESPRP